MSTIENIPVKRGRGRPKLTDKQRAGRAAARVASPKTMKKATTKAAIAVLPGVVAARAHPLLPGNLVDAHEVSARFSMSVSTIYAAVKRGDFPAPVKQGPRCVRWRTADLLAHQAAMRPSTHTRLAKAA